jgi:hypothetical protein
MPGRSGDAALSGGDVVTVTNLSASVRAKLLQRARDTNRPFQELLQYFAMERFLYRLSQSRHRQSFSTAA